MISQTIAKNEKRAQYLKRAIHVEIQLVVLIFVLFFVLALTVRLSMPALIIFVVIGFAFLVSIQDARRRLAKLRPPQTVTDENPYKAPESNIATDSEISETKYNHLTKGQKLIMIRQQKLLTRVRVSSFWIGVFLVAGGALSLVYLAMSIVQVIEGPGQSGLIKWLMVSINNELVMNGVINERTFELHISEVFHYMFLGIIGLIMLNILAIVVNTLISGGIELIVFSAKGERKENEKYKSNE